MNNQIISAKGKRKLTKPAIWAGLIIIVALLPLFITKIYLLHVFILTLIYIIAAVSFRMIATSGQFPLAHAAFMGVGAYAAAIPSKWFGWPVWLTIPLGGLVAMGIGILIGYPFARLRAIYYALASLFFGTGLLYFIFTFGIWTGSYSGLSGIPPILPIPKIGYYYFFLVVTSICLFALYRFETCRIGTSLKAVAQSHQLASSVGINEAGYRILALAIGCFFAGLAGTFYAHYNLTISYTSFNLSATLWLVMYVVIGGINSFAGPIIGTAILIIVPELFRELQQFAPYISAVILLIVVYALPGGLVSIPGIIKTRYIERRKGKEIGHAS